jgi:calnexin
VRSGNLLHDFDPPFNPEKIIDDPSDVKPADWIDEAKIPDPEAKKPDDWDEDAPMYIPDPNAKKPIGWEEDAPSKIQDPKARKPEDWDEELDGEWRGPLVDNPVCEIIGCGPWTPPNIKNPAYKGIWKAPLIDNPEYKGEWKPRKIENPHYFVDETPYKLSPIAAVGFELWTMQNGIEFDNIYVGNDENEAHELGVRTWLPKYRQDREQERKEGNQVKRMERERRRREGIGGAMGAYAEDFGDFMGEYPIPVFVSMVCILIGGYFYLEYKVLPRHSEDSDEPDLDADEIERIANMMKAEQLKKNE